MFVMNALNESVFLSVGHGRIGRLLLARTVLKNFDYLAAAFNKIP